MAQGYHGINQALGTVDRSQNTVSALAVSSTTTYNSVVMNSTGGMANFSYQCGVVTTSSLTGSFNVYVSNDPRAADSILWSSALWTLVQSVSFTNGVTTTGSQASTNIVVQNGNRFSYCSWVNASGSGTILAFGCGAGG